MKYYLNEREVSEREFEEARRNSFDDVWSYAAEVTPDDDVRDIKEAITLAFCVVIVAYGSYCLWQFFS